MHPSLCVSSEIGWFYSRKTRYLVIIWRETAQTVQMSDLNCFFGDSSAWRHRDVSMSRRATSTVFPESGPSGDVRPSRLLCRADYWLTCSTFSKVTCHIHRIQLAPNEWDIVESHEYVLVFFSFLLVFKDRLTSNNCNGIHLFHEDEWNCTKDQKGKPYT